MIIKEDMVKEAVIRLHNDYMKGYEESMELLENSYKLALLEIHGDSMQSKD